MEGSPYFSASKLQLLIINKLSLDEYKSRNGINLNLDGIKTPLKYLTRIGTIDLNTKEFRYYYDLLLEAAKNTNVKIEPFSIPFGVWTDSNQFARNGILFGVFGQ